MMNRLAIILVAVTAVGYYFNKQKENHQPSYLPWHRNTKWDRFLNTYDRIRDEMYKDCEVFTIPTEYGDTQCYACGSAAGPTVLLLHGAQDNALMWGSWLVPALVESSFYTVAVDYPCDSGRSIPLNGDVNNCPSTQEQVADCVSNVITGLQQMNKTTSPSVSLIGYSYGAFLSSVAALHKPELVDKVVMLAPAAVFASIRPGWLIRALASSMIGSDALFQYFHTYMSGSSTFDFDTFYSKDDREMMLAANDVGATIITITPESFTDEQLKQVCSEHDCFLGIGDRETVVNHETAVQRAVDSRAQVKVYPNEGHLMVLSEQASQGNIARDVVDFLSSTEKKK